MNPHHTSHCSAAGVHCHAHADDKANSACRSSPLHALTKPGWQHTGWSAHQQQAPSYSLIVRDTKAQKNSEMYLQSPHMRSPHQPVPQLAGCMIAVQGMHTDRAAPRLGAGTPDPINPCWNGVC